MLKFGSEILSQASSRAGSARLELKSKKLGSARLAKFRLVTMSIIKYRNRSIDVYFFRLLCNFETFSDLITKPLEIILLPVRTVHHNNYLC